MSESQQAELQHWQARCDEMQVALDRVREERDIWKTTCETQTLLFSKQEIELNNLKSIVERLKIALSQGQEL
jgi:hypothetical protein